MIHRSRHFLFLYFWRKKKVTILISCHVSPYRSCMALPTLIRNLSLLKRIVTLLTETHLSQTTNAEMFFEAVMLCVLHPGSDIITHCR